MIKCEFENGHQAKLRHTTLGAIVVRGDEILLEKRTKSLLEGGKWGIPGGYMELNETIPEALKREVHEETGWEIDDLKLAFVNSNPDRPGEDRQNVDHIFFATATKKTGEGDWESDDVKWFKLDNLPHEIAFDHQQSIDLYLKYRQKPFPLPILK